jgi:hypothetical protein
MTFEHDGRHITLTYVPDAVGIWEVYEGTAYLGVIVETYVDWEARYAPRRPGKESSPQRAVALAQDWRTAVVYLSETA